MMNENIYGAETTSASQVMESTVSKANAVRAKEAHFPENCRVHAINNGTYQAVISNGNEDSVFMEDGEASYVLNKVNFGVSFNREETDELFSISNGKYKIKVTAKRKQQSRKRPLIPILESKKENQETVTFADVLIGSDLEYSIVADGVKENIVVRKKKNSYKYQFIMEHRGMTPVLDAETREIFFQDTEHCETIFRIPAPVMFDAAENFSESVNYTLCFVDENTSGLTIVADSQWINAEERIFPVIIDPQILVQPVPSITTYTWNYSDLTDTVSIARPESVVLNRVGTVEMGGDTGYNIDRMYMKVQLPSFPYKARVKKAQLQLTQHSADVAFSSYPAIGLYRVTEAIQGGTTGITPTHEEKLLDYARIRTDLIEGEEQIKYN